jgi:hypothetical protein
MPARRTDSAAWLPIDAHVLAGRSTALGIQKSGATERDDEVRTQTGIDKVPGSLNLVADRRIWLRRRAGIEWSGGLLYHGRVDGVPVAFNVLGGFADGACHFYVYANRHLRSELGLDDGDVVTLDVPERAVVRAPLLNDAVYVLRKVTRKLRDRVVRPKVHMSLTVDQQRQDDGGEHLGGFRCHVATADPITIVEAGLSSAGPLWRRRRRTVETLVLPPEGSRLANELPLRLPGRSEVELVFISSRGSLSLDDPCSWIRLASGRLLRSAPVAPDRRGVTVGRAENRTGKEADR